MKCPCKECARKGCGKDHDSCEPYKEWAKKREETRNRRNADAEITGYRIGVAVKIRGAKR